MAQVGSLLFEAVAPALRFSLVIRCLAHLSSWQNTDSCLIKLSKIKATPLHVDIITAIDGVEFADAWPDRFDTLFGGVPAFVISRYHLITNKKTTARLQDLADVEQLNATIDRT